MNDQHPVPIWGFFFLIGLGLTGTLGAMIGPVYLFAGLLLGALLGGILEALLTPLRPDNSFFHRDSTALPEDHF